MGDIKTISILLLTKNAGPEFEQVLDRVDQQDVTQNIEIVVIDSGSTDGTVKRAAKYADTLVEIDPDEFHHSRTRNLAADKATGDVYVYLTQDARPLDDKWLASLINPLEDADVGAVYGQQVAYPDAKPMDKFFYSYFYPDNPRRLNDSDIDDEREFYLSNVFVSDVTSAIQAKVFNEIRFREDVPMSEDKDFALRALDEGYELIYEPEATVFHSHDYSILELFKRRFKDGKAYAEIAGSGKDDFVGEGIQYLREELCFLAKNGHSHWIPYALLYDFTYFAGFKSGKIIGNV